MGATPHGSARFLRACVAAAAAVVACACAGCGGANEPSVVAPRWIHLAEGFVPAADPESAPGRERFTPTDEPGWVLANTSCAAGDWLAHGRGLWSVPRVAPFPVARTFAGARLWIEGGAVEPFARGGALRQLERLRTDPWREGAIPALGSASRPCFALAGGRVYLLQAADAPAPTNARIEERVGVGEACGNRWRMRVPGLEVDAVPVLDGHGVSFDLDVPPGSVLRFGALAFGADGVSVRFRVRVNDRVSYDGRHDASDAGRAERQCVVLPGRGGALRLHLEVDVEDETRAALTAFVNPVIGPAAPAGDTPDRPDVILLLADTFRADNLTAWGGDPRIAPSINALAERSRRYLQARTPATWTLPAHASLFTSLYPYQTGIVSQEGRLPDEAWTLAEQLARAGYRTAAITDAGWVSATFGFAQGFEWFEEEEDLSAGSTCASIERVLDADDGRPLFLFVQSYRAHDLSEPVRPDAARRLGDDFGLGPFVGIDDAETYARWKDMLVRAPRGEPLTGAVYEELVRPKGPNYRGAAADADDHFGEYLEALARGGIGTRDVLCFTSDHGESFGDHGVVGHGTGVWDGQARVPLLIAAPGVEHGDDLRLASLIDLPRTLCALAGVEPHAEWGGSDLTGPDMSARPTFTFQCYRDRIQDIAIVHDRWKIVFEDETGPGPLRFVYDLRADPGEREDRSGDLEARELAQRLAPAAAAVSRPRLTGERARVGDRERERLDALGYGGDD